MTTLTTANWNTRDPFRNEPLWIIELERAKSKRAAYFPGDTKADDLIKAICADVIRLSGDPFRYVSIFGQETGQAKKIDPTEKSIGKIIAIISTLHILIDEKIRKPLSDQKDVKSDTKQNNESFYAFLKNECLNGRLRAPLGYGLLKSDDSFINLKQAIEKIDKNNQANAVVKNTAETINTADLKVEHVINAAKSQGVIPKAIEVRTPAVITAIKLIKERGYNVDITNDHLHMATRHLMYSFSKDPETWVIALISDSWMSDNLKHYNNFREKYALIDDEAIVLTQPLVTSKSNYMIEIDHKWLAYCSFAEDKPHVVSFVCSDTAADSTMFTVPLFEAGFPPAVLRIVNNRVAVCYPSKIIIINLANQQTDTLCFVVDKNGLVITENNSVNGSGDTKKSQDAKDTNKELSPCYSHVVSPSGKDILFIAGNYVYCLNFETSFCKARQLMEITTPDSRLIFRAEDRFAIICPYSDVAQTSLFVGECKLENTIKDPLSRSRLVLPQEFATRYETFKWNASLSPNGKTLVIFSGSVPGREWFRSRSLYFYDLTTVNRCGNVLCYSSRQDIYRTQDLHTYLQWQGSNYLITEAVESEYVTHQHSDEKVPTKTAAVVDKFPWHTANTKYLLGQEGGLKIFTIGADRMQSAMYMTDEQLELRRKQLTKALSEVLTVEFPKELIRPIAEYVISKSQMQPSASALSSSLMPAIGSKQSVATQPVASAAAGSMPPLPPPAPKL